MKKIISAIIAVLIIGALAMINNKETKEEFKIVNTYVTESGNTVVDFSDNSAAVINHDKGIYEFYTPECGDWELSVDNHENLINVVKTYIINRYNIQDADNHQVFKNVNLVGYIEQDNQANYDNDLYSKYLEYKSNLIEKYGHDVYVLMNQEAGIETEEESFKHFIKYGI